VDFALTQDGKVMLYRPGTVPRSASAWVSISSGEFSLEPQATRVIEINLSTPPDAAGGYYAAVVVEQHPERQPEAPTAVIRTYRVACILEFTVIGFQRLRQEARLDDFRVESDPEKGTRSYVLTVANLGNVHLRGKGEIVVETTGGRRLEQFPLEEGRGTVFPGFARDFRSDSETKLPPGEYVAKVTFRYGQEGKVIRSQISFTVGFVRGKEGEKEKEAKLYFVIDPSLIELEAPPGAFRLGNLEVINGPMEAARYSVVIQDVQMKRDGELASVPVGEGNFSCAPWIGISTSQFDLGTNESRKVPFEFRVPRDVSAGHYANIVVEAISYGVVQEKTVQTATVLLTISGPLDKELELSEFRVTEQPEKPQRMVVSVYNRGNIHLWIRGGVTVTDKLGRSVAQPRFEQDKALILPGAVRDLTATLSRKLDPGRYKADINLSYGFTETEIVRETRDFMIE